MQTHQAALFKSKGYVVAKEALSQSSLDRLRSDLNNLIDLFDHSLDKGCSLDQKLIALNRHNQKALYHFQVHASKLASLSALSSDTHTLLSNLSEQPQHCLFLEGMGYVLGIPHSDRLSYGWHQDGTYHQQLSGNSVHVWFPIFSPVTLNNGAMSFLSGSNELGVLPYLKSKPHPDGYTTNLVSGIDEFVNQYDEVICDLNVGDCVFFDDMLIHRSNPNKTERCRVAGVFKYSFALNFQTAIPIVGV
jgi:ectoine hydroxylase-related dioxygenase (phytanoyl-CoA dioxygenase family)